MKPFSLEAVALGATIASLLAIHGVRRKSLSQAGAITAWIVGFLSVACGLRGFVLLMFYLIGSKATKYRKDFKATKDGDAQHSAVRSPSQVLACSVIAVVCSVYHALHYGEEKAINFTENYNESVLACAVIAHYATCLADTLASELGILSKSQPFLCTKPWKKVPAGTNGGVTMLGFFWSALGGIFMGAGTLLMDLLSGIEIAPLNTIWFAAVCGLMGSILDSILGATVQATLYESDKKLVYCDKEHAPKEAKCISGLDILSNAQVNLLSVFMTTIVGGFFLGPMML